ELVDGDHLGVGPLIFAVRLQAGTAVDSPAQTPPIKESKVVEGDQAAATGTTIIEVGPAPTPAEPPDPTSNENRQSQLDSAKLPDGDTASAAKTILDKYTRRPRK